MKSNCVLVAFVLIACLLSGCNNPPGNENNNNKKNNNKKAPSSDFVVLGQAMEVATPERSVMGKPSYRQAKEVATVKARKQMLDWLAKEGATIDQLPAVAPKAHGVIDNKVIVCMEITATKLKQALSDKNISNAEAIATKTGKGIQSWASAPME